ncbi:hypothetical protein [Roseobacter weihaiensis]|uniref:hypothetical protein n=1 Tax=Roseobacter weihaiensis TaxID=2763262 RepID=UPI001D0A0172|nr:hypothetical protein [Roseobacter sp. H9]
MLTTIDPALVLPVRFSLDPNDLAKAFSDGVNRLCLITPLGDDMVGWQKVVLETARPIPNQRLLSLAI